MTPARSSPIKSSPKFASTSATRSCSTVVPRSVRLSEAPSYGQPITTFDPRSRGALAYRDVAKEIHDESTQRIG